ncbi:MAG: hypothetical protein ACJA02_001067 [Myxococcota bacterium]|jgi:hypothetical protein
MCTITSHFVILVKAGIQEIYNANSKLRVLPKVPEALDFARMIKWEIRI